MAALLRRQKPWLQSMPSQGSNSLVKRKADESCLVNETAGLARSVAAVESC